MNARCVQPGTRRLDAEGLSLPGYGLDLEVRPYPLAVRSNEASIHALCAEGISTFLGRVTASKPVARRMH